MSKYILRQYSRYVKGTKAKGLVACSSSLQEARVFDSVKQVLGFVLSLDDSRVLSLDLYRVCKEEKVVSVLTLGGRVE